MFTRSTTIGCCFKTCTMSLMIPSSAPSNAELDRVEATIRLPSALVPLARVLNGPRASRRRSRTLMRILREWVRAVRAESVMRGPLKRQSWRRRCKPRVPTDVRVSRRARAPRPLRHLSRRMLRRARAEKRWRARSATARRVSA